MRLKTNIRILAIMMLMTFLCMPASAQSSRNRRQRYHSSRKKSENHTSMSPSSNATGRRTPSVPLTNTDMVLPPINIPETDGKFYDGCQGNTLSFYKMMKEKQMCLEKGDTLLGESKELTYWKNEGKKGSAHAQFHYGLLLLKQSKSDQQHDEALRWILMAADNGCQDAARCPLVAVQRHRIQREKNE